MIDILTGQLGKRSNGCMESTNKAIAAFRVSNHEKFGHRLVLVETPGVDDDKGSDRAILQMISDWLPKSISLSGIIYLHRINDIRITGKPDGNLRRFGELCGNQWAQSVILVTTMWDKVQNRGLCENREECLKKEYWKAMIENGAALDRFLNTPDSAWGIIEPLVEVRMKAVPPGDQPSKRSVWGKLFGR